jgi:hypothetical protein
MNAECASAHLEMLLFSGVVTIIVTLAFFSISRDYTLF